jgi:hypothetical protein
MLMSIRKDVEALRESARAQSDYAFNGANADRLRRVLDFVGAAVELRDRVDQLLSQERVFSEHHDYYCVRASYDREILGMARALLTRYDKEES